MGKPSPSMSDLARRLLAVSRTAAGSPAHEAELVNEKLRIAVTRFAGADGFSSLLRRALVLARADAPALRSVRIGTGGRLEGMEQLASQAGSTRDEAAVAITAHLLGLLVTFIGERLMLRLVREAWPEIAQEASESGIEAAS